MLTNLSYTFIPPSECAALRGNTLASHKKSTYQVVLLLVMRAFLAKQRFSFTGKPHTLSGAAVDKVMHELKAANEKIYAALMYGVSVTEFIDGKKASPTIKSVDWHDIDNNAFHCTEELEVQTKEATK